MTGDGNRHKKTTTKNNHPPTPPTPVSSPFPTHPTPPLSPVDRRAPPPPPLPLPLPRRPPAYTIPTTITTPTESGGVLGEARNNRGERGMEGREVEVLIPILHPPAFHPPAPRESTRRPATETEHGGHRRRRRHRRAGARTHKRQRQKGPESLFMWPRASRRPATPPPRPCGYPAPRPAPVH